MGDLTVRVWDYSGVDPCVDGVLPDDVIETDLMEYVDWVLPPGGGSGPIRLSLDGPFIVTVEDEFDEVFQYWPPIEGNDWEVGCFDDSQSYAPDHIDIGTLTIEAPGDGLAEFVAAYADLNGVTLQEAQVRVEQERIIGEYLASIEEEIEGGLLDVWLDDSLGDLVLHARSGDADVLLVLAEATSEADIELSIDATTPLAAEATANLALLQDALLEAVPEIAGYYVDDVTLELVLDLVDESQSSPISPSSGQGSSLEERAILAAEELTNLPTRVDSITDWAGDAAAVYGGSALTGCTMGFTATYKSGSTTYHGFVTTAHCNRPLSYYYKPAVSGTPKTATYRTQKYDKYADIAFFSVASGDTVTNKFFGKSSTTPTVQGGPMCAAPGASVCRRGKMTGYDCSKIQSGTYAPTWNGNKACGSGAGVACATTFYKTTQKALKGDSGAPVFMGANSPVGLHKGGSPGWIFGIGQFSAFSKITYMPPNTTLK